MFSRAGSEVFVPDAVPAAAALARTTHLGIGAHADDLEIMAIHGILACYEPGERSFTGVVVTDGAGSIIRGDTSRAELAERRRSEQKRAATLGRYGAQVLLDYTSEALKDPAASSVVDDLVALLLATKPEVVYTHALTDTHDTHVAVTLRVLDACRKLSPEVRPPRVLGCEVWRGLDWLADADKVALPLDGYADLQASLLAVFASQLRGGKRYDLAALGRRRANAVLDEARQPDRHDGLVWAMDLTALAHGGGDALSYVRELVSGLTADVTDRLSRLAARTD